MKPAISHRSLAPFKHLLSALYTQNVIRKEMFVLLWRVSDPVLQVFYKLKKANRLVGSVPLSTGVCITCSTSTCWILHTFWLFVLPNTKTSVLTSENQVTPTSSLVCFFCITAASLYMLITGPSFSLRSLFKVLLAWRGETCTTDYSLGSKDKSYHSLFCFIPS